MKNGKWSFDDGFEWSLSWYIINSDTLNIPIVRAKFPIKYVRSSFDWALSTIDDGRTIDNV